MKILAIDTSCDETSVAITEERRVLNNVLFSQIKIHAAFGGVYPILAKREHLTKMQPALNLALKRARLKLASINALAVTFGPGLAPALEVGVNYAKKLAGEYHKPLIPVDHIEGHIYSSFVQNSQGKPAREFTFPMLAFIISGGHTELVLFKNHVSYQIIGTTLDDAAGEALDKAARLLGLGYPGGPVIERLAKKGQPDQFKLPVPMIGSQNLQFSYSGLKTAFKRLVESLAETDKLRNLENLSAAFQETIIRSLLVKLEAALSQYPVKTVVFGGGVSDNQDLRRRAIKLVRHFSLPCYFPPYRYLTGDNAAMIGVAAYYKYRNAIYLKDPSKLDRIPRANLDNYVPTEGIEPPTHRL